MTRDDDRKQVLKLLQIAAGMPDARTFADKVLELRSNAWSNIVGGQSFPNARLLRLEKYFSERFRTFSFNRHHLELPPNDFVNLFRSETVYTKLLDAIGHSTDMPHAPPHPLERFFGHFLGIYICRNPSFANEFSREAVAIDAFKIYPDVNDTVSAKIEQITNAFTTQPSIGRFRVLWDTIEIIISQGNMKDPDATYMAVVPRGSRVNSLLGVGTDIKFETRLVVARPTIFIRVDEENTPISSETYADKTDIYILIKDLISKYFLFDSERYELTSKIQIEEQDEIELKNAILALQREDYQSNNSGEPT